MRPMRLPALLLFFLIAFTGVSGQKADVTISLNEQFFDAALEAIFKNGEPLEFSIAGTKPAVSDSVFVNAGYSPANCSETIKLRREIGGVHTAVRFRDGRILAPLAFSGNYNPPFVGCVPFSGWAETAIDLEFDQAAQRLIARARVLNVSLSGTGGIGGTVVAKLVQSSIDKKINPIELFHLDKLSFGLPVRGAATMQMKAVGIRHELQTGAINIVVSYEFIK